MAQVWELIVRHCVRRDKVQERELVLWRNRVPDVCSWASHAGRGDCSSLVGLGRQELERDEPVSDLTAAFFIIELADAAI